MTVEKHFFILTIMITFVHELKKIFESQLRQKNPVGLFEIDYINLKKLHAYFTFSHELTF